MRFGGHQTFSIRDGWMHKGLQALVEAPQVFGTETLRDELGVGKNMARSIEHWLVATGLARRTARAKKAPLELTDLGRLVWQYDRYLLFPGTWWILHARLVESPGHAFSWHWFFNHFTQARFERATAVDAIRRHLMAAGDRMPSMTTLERDVACLLRTYSETLPREPGEPEDNLDCPMVGLGIMKHSRQSGFYHVQRGVKEIPFAVFGWLVGRHFAASEERRQIDVSLTELAYEADGPGRVFQLSAEATFELLRKFEDAEKRVTLNSQAGERILRLANQPADDWLEEYFSSLPQQERTTERPDAA